MKKTHTDIKQFSRVLTIKSTFFCNECSKVMAKWHITCICRYWIYKYNDVRETETKIQLDSLEQGVLFIYIQLCRCKISLRKCNVSRQEASGHVLSTSLSLPYSPSPSRLPSLSLSLSLANLSSSCFPPKSNPLSTKRSHAPRWRRPSHVQHLTKGQVGAILAICVHNQHCACHVRCLRSFYDHAAQWWELWSKGQWRHTLLPGLQIWDDESQPHWVAD